MIHNMNKKQKPSLSVKRIQSPKSSASKSKVKSPKRFNLTAKQIVEEFKRHLVYNKLLAKQINEESAVQAERLETQIRSQELKIEQTVDLMRQLNIKRSPTQQARQADKQQLHFQELKSTVGKLQRTIADKLLHSEEQRNESSSLRAELASRNWEMRQVNQKFQILQAECSSAADRHAQYLEKSSEKIRDLQQQLAVKCNSLKNLQASLSKMNQMNTHLQRNLDLLADQLVQQKKERNTREGESSKKKAQLAECIQKLNKQKTVLQQNNSRLEEKVRQMALQLNRMDSDKQLLSLQINYQLSSLQKGKQVTSSLEHQLASSKNQLQLERFASAARQLRVEQEWRVKTKTLQTVVDEYKSFEHKHHIQMADLQSKIKTLTDQQLARENLQTARREAEVVSQAQILRLVTELRLKESLLQNHQIQNEDLKVRLEHEQFMSQRCQAQNSQLQKRLQSAEGKISRHYQLINSYQLLKQEKETYLSTIAALEEDKSEKQLYIQKLKQLVLQRDEKLVKAQRQKPEIENRVSELESLVLDRNEKISMLENERTSLRKQQNQLIQQKQHLQQSLQNIILVLPPGCGLSDLPEFIAKTGEMCQILARLANKGEQPHQILRRVLMELQSFQLEVLDLKETAEDLRQAVRKKDAKLISYADQIKQMEKSLPRPAVGLNRPKIEAQANPQREGKYLKDLCETDRVGDVQSISIVVSEPIKEQQSLAVSESNAECSLLPGLKSEDQFIDYRLGSDSQLSRSEIIDNGCDLKSIIKQIDSNDFKLISQSGFLKANRIDQALSQRNQGVGSDSIEKTRSTERLIEEQVADLVLQCQSQLDAPCVQLNRSPERPVLVPSCLPEEGSTSETAKFLKDPRSLIIGEQVTSQQEQQLIICQVSVRLQQQPAPVLVPSCILEAINVRTAEGLSTGIFNTQTNQNLQQTLTGESNLIIVKRIQDQVQKDRKLENQQVFKEGRKQPQFYHQPCGHKQSESIEEQLKTKAINEQQNAVLNCSQKEGTEVRKAEGINESRDELRQFSNRFQIQKYERELQGEELDIQEVGQRVSLLSNSSTFQLRDFAKCRPDQDSLYRILYIGVLRDLFYSSRVKTKQLELLRLFVYNRSIQCRQLSKRQTDALFCSLLNKLANSMCENDMEDVLERWPIYQQLCVSIMKELGGVGYLTEVAGRVASRLQYRVRERGGVVQMHEEGEVGFFVEKKAEEFVIFDREYKFV